MITNTGFFVFTAWVYDQNCLQKTEIHSSEITDYLGTLSVLSASQKAHHLCNIQMEAGIDQVTKKNLYIMSALGHAAESEIRSSKAY